MIIGRCNSDYFINCNKYRVTKRKRTRLLSEKSLINLKFYIKTSFVVNILFIRVFFSKELEELEGLSILEKDILGIFNKNKLLSCTRAKIK